MAEMTYETLEQMLCGGDQTVLRGFAGKVGFDVETTEGLNRRKYSTSINSLVLEIIQNSFK